MGIPQLVYLGLTVLISFGVGLEIGRKNDLPRWQVICYLILIILGMIGVNS